MEGASSGLYEPYRLDTVLRAVVEELQRAGKIHPLMHSHHEAKAVIEEELDEYWEQVKLKDRDGGRLAYELTQIAAMAIRALVDLKPGWLDGGNRESPE
jgi:hypothetical protein